MKFVLLLLITLVASSVVIPRQATAATLNDKQPGARWVTLLQADFDGDGHADVVRGQTTAIPDAYRQVVVQTPAGKVLLDITRESFYYLITTDGAKPPMLLLGSPSGKWLGVEAFMYSPATGRMTRLRWDDDDYVLGDAVKVDPATGAVRMWAEKGWVTYRLEQGVMREQK